MRFPPTLILALYKVIWIYGGTAVAASSPDDIAIDQTSTENGERLERLQRSVPPFDFTRQLQNGETFNPDRRQLLLYPRDQMASFLTPNLPIRYSSLYGSFDYEGSPTSHQGLAECIDAHLIKHEIKQTPDRAEPDPTGLPWPLNFHSEPETQVESPISSQNEGHGLKHYESLPPTLHHCPHDAFPCTGHTVLAGSPVHPIKLIYQEEQLFQGEDLGNRFKGRSDYAECIPLGYSDQPSRRQDFIFHREHKLNPTECESSCFELNCNNRKQANIRDVEKLSDACCGIEKITDLGPADISLLKVHEYLDVVSSDCDKTLCCSGDHNSEENCGKIVSKSINSGSQTCLSNEKTVNKNPCFDGEDSRKDIETTFRAKSSCGARKSQKEQKLEELRAILRNIAGYRCSKHRSPSKDVNDRLFRCPESTEDCSCVCKCFDKLFTFLHLAKEIGGLIADKAHDTLGGLRGLKIDELLKCETDSLSESRNLCCAK